MQARTVKIMRRSLIGLAIAALLSVLLNYAHVWYRRARLVEKAAKILGPEMLRSFEGFEYSSTPNGVLRFRIKAKRRVDTRKGKSYIEGIEAYDFDPDGRARNRIHSARAMFDREHSSVEFSENVSVFLNNEVELRTNQLHYDLNARKGGTTSRIQFISRTAGGTAKGLFFDQGQKTLELKGEVDIALTAGINDMVGQVRPRRFLATADHALYTEDLHRAVFRGRARIHSDPDELSADSVEAILSSDRKRVISLICTGSAAYRTKKQGEGQLLRGDRMVFAIDNRQSLEKVEVTGVAEFSMESAAGAQALSGSEIGVFFDAATTNPSRIEGRGSVRFRRMDAKTQVEVSGDAFVAAFYPESKNLRSVTVRERASMSIEDRESSARNELKSEEMLLSFHGVDDRTAIDRLRAAGAARWEYKPEPGNRPIPRQPERILAASLIEMVFSSEGTSFESGSASGGVVISESRAGTDGVAKLTRLLADSAEFGFFSGRNKLRTMSAHGRVRTEYEKGADPHNKSAAQKFSATSQNIEAIFGLRNGENAVESAAQWGDFVYRDASMTATADRCEYDASKGILVLKGSPRISEGMSDTSGERVEYDLAQKSITVAGRVRSRLNTRGNNYRFPAFSSSSPILITADEMRYWTEGRRARYSGKVQVLSESGQLEAGRLDIIEEGNRLEAHNSVRHYVPKREASKSGELADKFMGKRKGFSSEMTIRSSTLKYERQKNAITYADSVTVRSGDITLSSDELVAAIAENGGGIERATARGRVRIRQNGREGKADVADYFLNPQKLVLTGNPAEISETGKVRSAAPQLTYYIVDDRILSGSD